MYLLKEREFCSLNQPVYKFGFSNDFTGRMKNYPKGSIVLMSKRVNDGRQVEREVMCALCKRFKQRKDLGREYFEGPLREILAVCDAVVGRSLCDSTCAGENEMVMKKERAFEPDTWSSVHATTCADSSEAGHANIVSIGGRTVTIVKHYSGVTETRRSTGRFALVASSGIMKNVKRSLPLWVAESHPKQVVWDAVLQREERDVDEVRVECKDAYDAGGVTADEPVTVFEGGLCKDVEAHILKECMCIPEVVAFDDDMLLLEIEPLQLYIHVTGLVSILDKVCDELGIPREKGRIDIYKIRADMEYIAEACVVGNAEVEWDSSNDDVKRNIVCHSRERHGFPTFRMVKQIVGAREMTKLLAQLNANGSRDEKR